MNIITERDAYLSKQPFHEDNLSPANYFRLVRLHELFDLYHASGTPEDLNAYWDFVQEQIKEV